MKKILMGILYPHKKLQKALKVMRLTCFFVLLLCLQVHAEVYSQATRLSLELSNVSIEEVFSEIEKQSDFAFTYNIRDIETINNITIDIHDALIHDVMNKCLENTLYSYEVIDKHVILVKKKLSTIKDNLETITGVVKDDHGCPLPGVSVSIKGKITCGVSTDIDGKFSIKVTKGDILVFSFIGMKTLEVKIKERKEINVVLKEDKKSLNEVVVTGYQTIEKRKLSSSVVTLGANKLKGAVVSVDNMLQGKIAGLSVLNPTSTVGAAPRIRIRGISSISGNREPLWVVDGVILDDPVPLSSTELNSLDNINLIGNAISSINPEDIQRIDVLKDASATAIYGVKAANGVIVVTTKSGELGKPKVSYSSTYTINERPTYGLLNRMNSKERIEVSREAQAKGLTYEYMSSPVAYEGLLLDFQKKKITYDEFIMGVNRLETENTDWFDLIYRTAFSQKHNVSVSGGDKRTKYYFSGSYTNSEGNFINNDLDQYNGLLKIKSKLTKRLNVGIQLNVSSNEKVYQHSNINPFQYAYKTSRALAAYNPDGTYAYYNKSQGNGVSLYYNIMNELDNSERTIGTDNMSFISDFDFKILKSLSLAGLVSVNKTTTSQKEWFNDKTYSASLLRAHNLTDPMNAETYEYTTSLPYGGIIDNEITQQLATTGRANLIFNKCFNEKHVISSTVGMEIRSVKYTGIYSKEYGYLPERGETFAEVNGNKFQLHRKTIMKNKDVITNRLNNLMSFYGTFTYDYDDRYIVNFNIRADGSNKFGQDESTKFLPVWSVSGRWNIHNEKILDTSSWLNQLSVRASYGIQGNISPEQSPNLIVNFGGISYSTGHKYLTLKTLPNPNLTWEKTISYNTAVDFSILDNRISGSVDLYKKRGENMLVYKDVAPSTGALSAVLNAGTIENRGFDIALNIIPIKTRDITWSISINGGKNENEIIDAGVTNYTYRDYINGTAIIPGKSLNSFYSYRFDKLDEDGLPTFKGLEEVEGDTKESVYKKALSYSGKRIADIEGGFSTNLKYKRLSLGAVFFYSLGKTLRLNDLYSSTGQKLPNPQQNMSSEFVNRWRKPGDEKYTNIPRLSNDELLLKDDNRNIEIAENKWEMYNKSDARLASGDFLSLQNITLQYMLDESLCKKLHFSNISLRATVTELYCWKDKKLGNLNPMQPSLYSGAAPPTRSFVLGLNLTF